MAPLPGDAKGEKVLANAASSKEVALRNAKRDLGLLEKLEEVDNASRIACRLAP